MVERKSIRKLEENGGAYQVEGETYSRFNRRSIKLTSLANYKREHGGQSAGCDSTIKDPGHRGKEPAIVLVVSVPVNGTLSSASLISVNKIPADD